MIKPIPETVKSEDHPMLNELQADPNDDEMFLNEDEVAEMRRSKLRKFEKLANSTANEQYHLPNDAQEPSSATESIHVIFKRSVEQHQPHNQQHSDFGIYCFFIRLHLILTCSSSFS